MNVRRVMGIETEYGIAVPSSPGMDPVALSTHLVRSYASTVGLGEHVLARWDYQQETPLRDARGFDMSRAEADPTQLTDDDAGFANIILRNGARLYVDHAHPEYSAPEVLTPFDAMIYDRAGQVIMQRAAAGLAHIPELSGVRIYKNNTDGKGSSYGTHENYLMDRRTPFTSVITHLTPFFVSRIVVTGAGRVGIGPSSETAGYQISARADFFETEVGLETTLKRPIINTRDEPHADPELYRRLHVIVGDANMSETATVLKLATTSVMLSMIEDNWPLPVFPLADPVAAFHHISHDPSLTACVELNDGRSVTALDIQRAYADAAAAYCASEGCDADTRWAIDTWQTLLDQLATDPMQTSHVIDWVAKLRLLSAYRHRDNLDWDAARLHLVDLQYSDIDPSRSLAVRLEQRGQLSRMSTDEQVQRAISTPPPETRAYFRGECVGRYPDKIAAASWDSVIFDMSADQPLVRIPTLDPFKGSEEHVASLLNSCPTAEKLVAALAQPARNRVRQKG